MEPKMNFLFCKEGTRGIFGKIILMAHRPKPYEWARGIFEKNNISGHILAPT